MGTPCSAKSLQTHMTSRRGEYLYISVMKKEETGENYIEMLHL
jgi:hypothetical protein